jgi:hypothetical protein
MLGALPLLALASPGWPAMRRSTTNEETTVPRWPTIGDDGTRAVSRYHKILDRWETTITTSPHLPWTVRMDPLTKQVEVRCR